MQTISDQLTTDVVSSFSPNAAYPGHPLKGVNKTMTQLAKQLTKHQVKQEHAAPKNTAPTAKMQRKALAGELLALLRPQLGLGTTTSTKAPKIITKTVNRLAAKLIKQRRKHARQFAKAARKAAKQLQTEETLAPVLQVLRLAPASNGRTAPAARVNRVRRTASNGALATGVAKKELAATPSAT